MTKAIFWRGNAHTYDFFFRFVDYMLNEMIQSDWVISNFIHIFRFCFVHRLCARPFCFHSEENGCALGLLYHYLLVQCLHLHLTRAHKVNIGKCIILINLIEQIESEQRKISDLSKCSKIRRKKTKQQQHTDTISMDWHRSVDDRPDKFADGSQSRAQQLRREPIKNKRHQKFPLWCKYFHISVCVGCCVCTLTYWHINCNQVRSVCFVSFFFCCYSALFFPFVWALRFFFLCRIVLRFQY